MRITTLFLFAFFVAQLSFAQTRIFSGYDFNSGEYAIVGTSWGGCDRNSLFDSIREFYTTDTTVLNQIQREWVFTTPSPQYACGFHYVVSVCRNGIALEEYFINLNCNEIIGEKGCFYFDTNKLRMFAGRLDKVIKRVHSFSLLSDARKALAETLADTTVLMVPPRDWSSYEGTFSFTYHCEKDTGDCLDMTETLLKRLTAEIEKMYPGEKFELEGRGGSNTEIFVEVKCYKTLSDKFTLYDRHPEYDRWKPYALNLVAYWPQKRG